MINEKYFESEMIKRCIDAEYYGLEEIIICLYYTYANIYEMFFSIYTNDFLKIIYKFRDYVEIFHPSFYPKLKLKILDSPNILELEMNRLLEDRHIFAPYREATLIPSHIMLQGIKLMMERSLNNGIDDYDLDKHQILDVMRQFLRVAETSNGRIVKNLFELKYNDFYLCMGGKDSNDFKGAFIKRYNKL